MADSFLSHKLEFAVPVAAVLAGALILLPWAMGEGPVGKFPLIGKELGSFEKRRKYYLKNALDLHTAGYKKVFYLVFQPLQHRHQRATS